MRESADDAQRLVNQATANLGNIDTRTDSKFNVQHQGSIRTLDSIDELVEIAESSILNSEIDLGRDIDIQLMDEIYSVLRNNSDRRNDGYNQFRGLTAVGNNISPQMITGAKPETVDKWYEQFRNAGLTYQEEGQEVLTTEGRIFLDEAYGFIEYAGEKPETREGQDYIADVLGSFSRRTSHQNSPLAGFLYAADQELSTSRIAEVADVSERTVYNWMKKWNGNEEDSLNLIRGEPHDRRLTSKGRAAYEMIENQYGAIDIASEMKALMIEELEDRQTDTLVHPFVTGNQRLVSQYLDDPSLAEKYMVRN